MTQSQWRVNLFCIMTSIMCLCACVSSELPLEKQVQTNYEDDVFVSKYKADPLNSFATHQNTSDQMNWARMVGARGQSLPGELSALGASRVEPIDLGYAAKIGQTVVFAAERNLIPDYDRLYWVMIRVLSEKYGCFIRKKIDRGELVAFKCRDQRIVTFRRRLTERYAVFKARQYRSDGREIVILSKRSRGASATRVVAKQP